MGNPKTKMNQGNPTIAANNFSLRVWGALCLLSLLDNRHSPKRAGCQDHDKQKIAVKNEGEE